MFDFKRVNCIGAGIVFLIKKSARNNVFTGMRAFYRLLFRKTVFIFCNILLSCSYHTLLRHLQLIRSSFRLYYDLFFLLTRLLSPIYVHTILAFFSIIFHIALISNLLSDFLIQCSIHETVWLEKYVSITL